LLTSLSDLAELEPSKTWKTEFPDPDDILNFVLTIEPDEGMYKGGRFHFNFAINQNFPHDPPKVKCTQKIYHPNVDLEGNVCLNILREDWKPVLNLNAVIVGLQVSGRGTKTWLDMTLTRVSFCSWSRTRAIRSIRRRRKI
jgi:ubiquitin-protein ligase